MRFIAALLLALLTGCQAAVPSATSTDDAALAKHPRADKFKGYYVSGFERREFRPESSLEQRWWLSGSLDGCGFLDFNQERYSPWRQTYVEFRGELSSPGRYGHLGAYDREITVVKFESCRAPLDGEGIEP